MFFMSYTERMNLIKKSQLKQRLVLLDLLKLYLIMRYQLHFQLYLL